MLSHFTAAQLQSAYPKFFESPRTILVTGATGFVGSHLVRALLDCQQRVIAVGRNPIRLPIGHPNLTFRYFSFLDRSQDMRSLFTDDTELVYHVAASTSPWGRRQDFESANIDGTARTVQASLASKISRLIYVSTTALQFDFQDRTEIREDQPLPTRFACEYARSKAVAEQIVHAATQQGLPAITIRARAVFGPGDRSLFPRLLRAAEAGRLPILGEGSNRIDLTYCDNLIHALLLSAHQGTVGATYTITNDQPVMLWQVIQQIATTMEFKRPRIKRLPYRLASGLAACSEWTHRTLPWIGEPKLTRYTVGLLAKTQTFDITAAKQHLGYRPLVSMHDAISSTLAHLADRDESHASTIVKFRPFSTGYTMAPSRLVARGTSTPTQQRLHASFGILEHPRQGICLIDTGYSPRFYEATRHWPYQLYRHLTPVVTKPAWSAVAWLNRLGFSAADVKRIIVTHFHADHVGGLLDFPDAEIIASKAAWDCFRTSSGRRGLMRAFLPGHVPDDLERRGRWIDQYDDPGVVPIEKCHDLFEDGSVRLFDISGHATGQLGLLLQTGVNTRLLHAADAAWSTQTILRDEPFTWPFRLLAASSRQAVKTRRRLHQVMGLMPDLELMTTHCPDVAMRYRFDEQLLETEQEARTT